MEAESAVGQKGSLSREPEPYGSCPAQRVIQMTKDFPLHLIQKGRGFCAECISMESSRPMIYAAADVVFVSSKRLLLVNRLLQLFPPVL